MAATLTLTLKNVSQATAGQGVCFTIAQSGGSAWTNGDATTTYPFSVSGGLNPIILNQNTTGSNSCDVTLYTGDSGAPVTLTDTVNNVSVTFTPATTLTKRAVTGKVVYVLGGPAQPEAPLLTVVGTPGSTIYSYQVVARNANGTTAARTYTGSSGINFGNVPANTVYTSSTAIAANLSSSPIAVPQGISTVANAPDTLSGSNYITVSWPLVGGATGYDLYRQKQYDGVGNLWYLLSSNQATGTYNDQSNSTGSSVTPPVNYTAALGSDSANGLTIGTAVATLAKAVTLVSAGDQIQISGTVPNNATADVPTAIPDGVGVASYSNDPTKDVIYYTGTVGNTTNACIRVGSNTDVLNLGIKTDIPTIFPIACLAGDTAIVNVRFYGCVIAGWTNAFRINKANCSFDFYDCSFISTHGLFGILAVAGGVINLTRCKLVSLSGTALTTSIATQAQGGFIFARDCQYTAGLDSNNPPSGLASCINSTIDTAARGVFLTNCRLDAKTYEIIVTGAITKLTGIWLRESPISASKNATAISTLGAKFNYSQTGTRIADPLLNASGGSGGGGGGNGMGM